MKYRQHPWGPWEPLRPEPHPCSEERYDLYSTCPLCAAWRLAMVRFAESIRRTLHEEYNR